MAGLALCLDEDRLDHSGVSAKLIALLGASAVHLNNFADLGHVHELIDKTLPVNLGQDAPLVVVPA